MICWPWNRSGSWEGLVFQLTSNGPINVVRITGPRVLARMAKCVNGKVMVEVGMKPTSH